MIKKTNYRRTYFIDQKFQLNFMFKFCALVIIGSLMIGVLIYAFSLRSTTVVFEHSRAMVKSTADFILPILLQTILVVSIVVAISTIILILFISHKIAGPLYRLKKELSTIGGGNLANGFSIRKDDQLQEMAVCVSSMVKGLRDRIANLKHDWRGLKDHWEALLTKGSCPDLNQDQDIAKIRETIVQIDKDFSYFKTSK